jgi:hypothetical protein
MCLTVFLRYLLGMQNPSTVPHCYLWLTCLYRVLPHYLINGTISGKKIFEHKICVFSLYTILTETLSILRKIQRDMIIKVNESLCKVPVIIVIC